jgi:hypothetical protein
MSWEKLVGLSCYLQHELQNQECQFRHCPAMVGFSKGNLVHHDEHSMGILVIGKNNHATEVTQLSLVQ